METAAFEIEVAIGVVHVHLNGAVSIEISHAKGHDDNFGERKDSLVWCVMQNDVYSAPRRARLTFSKISEARAVQMKGLGFWL